LQNIISFQANLDQHQHDGYFDKYPDGRGQGSPRWQSKELSGCGRNDFSKGKFVFYRKLLDYIESDLTWI
jgi:hypothetical protein